jgi:hypothetical protein
VLLSKFIFAKLFSSINYRGEKIKSNRLIMNMANISVLVETQDENQIGAAGLDPYSSCLAV